MAGEARREVLRYLERTITEDALASGKMAFVSGPRQVGKTTLGRHVVPGATNRFTWDEERFRRAWASDPVGAIAGRGAGPVLLDEIHKDRRWKRRLKGLFDTRGSEVGIVVTGSGRLDLYRRGGDSLMGRFLPYRPHPLSVGERVGPPGPDEAGEAATEEYPFDDILELGGFPEPLLSGSRPKASRWSRLRAERLVFEDVRDLRNVLDLQAMRVLVDLLPSRVGSLLSVNSLREDVGVAYATVRDWIGVLEALYHCFLIRPWAGRLSRALKAEPKLYLYDVLPIGSRPARVENVTALHLLKACHFWTDAAHGSFDLRFVRTREKKEVDFAVIRDGRPWMLVECKSGTLEPTPPLIGFARALGTRLNYQLVDSRGHDREFPEKGVRVMDYRRFLAGLV